MSDTFEHILKSRSLRFTDRIALPVKILHIVERVLPDETYGSKI